MNCTACNAPLAADADFCSKCGTPVAQLNPDFAEAERAYAGLRVRYEAGALDAAAFKAEVEAHPIDHDGRYWMIGVESGAWYAHDGERWSQAEPPRAAAAAGNAQQAEVAAIAPLPAPRAGTRPPFLAEPPLALVATAVAIGGFLLAAFASGLPMHTLRWQRHVWTDTGWDKWDREFMFVVGAAALGLVALFAAGLIARLQLRQAATLMAVACAALLLAPAVFIWFDTATQTLADSTGISAYSREIGPYVLLAGTGLALAGSVLAAIVRRLSRTDASG